MFQHTAARRRLHLDLHLIEADKHVSTHSRPKAAACEFRCFFSVKRFQHTAARRRLPLLVTWLKSTQPVSTHSRPKAAAAFLFLACQSLRCFNTQPPEGGCLFTLRGKRAFHFCFNTQPPEGGCQNHPNQHVLTRGFNTQPPEGGCVRATLFVRQFISFNTQPPEGGCSLYKKMIKINKLFTVFRYPLKYKEYQEV